MKKFCKNKRFKIICSVFRDKFRKTITFAFMKKLFYLVAICLGFVSCDDGEVIFTSFDFDEIDLRYCGDVGDFVFFKINNENRETLSLQLRTQDSIFWIADTTSYTLGGSSNHLVHYRKYNGEVQNSYFCNSIPPVNPEVTQEYISTAGRATAITKIETDSTGNTISTKYTTQIILNDLRMESGSEAIVKQTLHMGVIERTEQE